MKNNVVLRRTSARAWMVLWKRTLNTSKNASRKNTFGKMTSAKLKLWTLAIVVAHKLGGGVLTCEKPDLFLAPHPPPPPLHLVSNYSGYIWFIQDISGLYNWFIQDITGLYRIFLVSKGYNWFIQDVHTGYFWFIQDITGLHRLFIVYTGFFWFKCKIFLVHTGYNWFI